jgi:agmatinase
MNPRTTGPPTLVGIPYDASSSFERGSAEAPALIREQMASPAGNRFSEDLRDLGAEGVVRDAGDLTLPPTAEARAAIEEGIAKIVAGGGRPLALGGDHSVTYPILRGLNPSRAPLAILHVDAHGDLYDVFEGDRYSHACPFARILEEGLASRLVQVGIRAQTPHQRDQAARFGVEVIDMRAWVAGRRPEIAGPVYVSIDLDGLDPSAAPGVSHREPGGLTVREVLTLLQALAGPIVGGDVVELNPHRDLDRVTARVGAKLARELAAAMLRTAEIGTPS